MAEVMEREWADATQQTPVMPDDMAAPAQMVESGKVPIVPEKETVAGAAADSQEEPEEITIKFGKGLCSEPFQAKDGNSYVQIKIPEENKGIWPTFVLPEKSVHENKFGKGLWAKIPAKGTTKIRRARVVGEDQIGKKIYDHSFEKVPNKTLKAMVEAYKERNRDPEAKPSITGQLKEPLIPVVPDGQSVKPPVAGEAR